MNIRTEFGLDHLTCHKTNFFVKKKDLPPNGQENIELLDHLLNIRSNEFEEDIISELDKLIFDICTK